MKVLISPIDVREAIDAAAGGADIVDLKNVREGSLGASFPWLIQEARRRLARRRLELSAAIGDLDGKPGTAALAAYGAAACGARYVKAGLFAVRGRAAARAVIEAVARAARGVDRSVVPVAAAYGDYRRFGGLSPRDLVAAARGSGAGMVMLDTALKDGRSLFDHVSVREAREFVRGAHRAGLRAALAGSLRREHLATVAAVGADVIGVRGAVCEGSDRKARLSRESVARFIREARSLRR